MDAFDRRPADEGGCGNDLHGRQAGRVLFERLHGDPGPGHDDAAEIVTRGTDHVEGRGGSEIDDDEIAVGVQVHGPDRIGDAVRAYLKRIPIANLEPRLHPRLQNEGIDCEVLPAAAPQRVDQIRDHGTQRNPIDPGGIAVVLAKDPAQEESELVRREGGAGRCPEPERQLPVIEQASEHLTVADIKCEDHGRSPRDTLSISRTSPRRTAPSRRPSWS